MRLVMTLLVSDEAELIGPNLEYHLARGVDFVVVTANRSPDEILSTVQGYVERGVARLLVEESETYQQSEWITRMARLAATDHGADWVINADVDEFYWVDGGTLKEVFAAIPAEYGALTLPIRHFAPRPDSQGFFADRMTVREVTSGKKQRQAGLAPKRTPCTKVAHRAASELTLSRGAHRVSGVKLKHVPAWRPILGFHFPLRSYAQFERKVVKDGQALANNPDPSAGEHGRNLYRLYERGELPGHWAERVVDDRRADDEIREGRLVVDERLKRFFAERGRAASGAIAPAEEDPERVEAFRTAMKRAIWEEWRNPLSIERSVLRTRLAEVERRADELEERLSLSERERRRAERREARSRAELAGGLAGLLRRHLRHGVERLRSR